MQIKHTAAIEHTIFIFTVHMFISGIANISLISLQTGKQNNTNTHTFILIKHNRCIAILLLFVTKCSLYLVKCNNICDYLCYKLALVGKIDDVFIRI